MYFQKRPVLRNRFFFPMLLFWAIIYWATIFELIGKYLLDFDIHFFYNWVRCNVSFSGFFDNPKKIMGKPKIFFKVNEKFAGFQAHRLITVRGILSLSGQKAVPMESLLSEKA